MRVFRSIISSVIAISCLAPIGDLNACPDRGLLRPAGISGASTRDRTGIREIVPAHARQKYAKWKEELLSTKFGRDQWNAYADRKDFLLTIEVTDDRKYGAGTGDFEWDDRGKLVRARITLGKSLDKGYPDPVYYPVMNSLGALEALYEIDGNILASAKLMHEIAHVNSTAEEGASVFQRQDKLMASYNTIFLRNGYNTEDPRLVALADELGARPVEIWESREYQSEAAAMQYLMERINRERFYCAVLGRIKRNIADYARAYQDKFEAINLLEEASCKN